MPDNNHILRAHRLRSLADMIETEGLAATFTSALRGETSITSEDLAVIERGLKGYEPDLVVILRAMALDAVGVRG
jgi:hypothetical protein